MSYQLNKVTTIKRGSQQIKRQKQKKILKNKKWNHNQAVAINSKICNNFNYKPFNRKVNHLVLHRSGLQS